MNGLPTDILNNREMAVAIWLGLFGAWFASNSAVRESLAALPRAFFNGQILVPIALQVAYIGLAVYGLSKIGLWNLDQLKSTLLWIVLVGFASMARIATSREDPKLIRAWIEDNLKLLVLVEFIVNFYTFPLIAELILVPSLTAVVVMTAIAERRKEFQKALGILNGLSSVFGAAIITYALYRIFIGFAEFANLQTVRDLSTPPILSLLLVPFLFVLHVYVSYENTFLRLQWAVPNRHLRRFAMIRAILAFRCHAEMLTRWSRSVGIMRPTDRDGVLRLIEEVKDAWYRERNPPAVAPSEGWSPYAATKFLSEAGIVAGDYHRVFDEWFAESPRLAIGDDLSMDGITFYVEGDEHAAKRLKLVLQVLIAAGPIEPDLEFKALARVLSDKALGKNIDVKDLKELLDQDSGELRFGDKELRLAREDWRSSATGGYERKFIIEHVGAPKAA